VNLKRNIFDVYCGFVQVLNQCQILTFTRYGTAWWSTRSVYWIVNC